MTGRQRLPVSNAIGFSNAPVEVIVGGGIFVAGSLAFLVSEAIKASKLNGAQPGMGPVDSLAVEAPLPRKDAVLIFGASGRSGREIVSKVRALICCSVSTFQSLLVVCGCRYSAVDER